MTSLTAIPKTTFPDSSPWLNAVIERRAFERQHTIEDPEHGSVLHLPSEQAIQEYLALLAAEEQLLQQAGQAAHTQPELV